MSDQMIFKRYEMKYLLNRTQYRQITEAFEGRMKPDMHYVQKNTKNMQNITKKYKL